MKNKLYYIIVLCFLSYCTYAQKSKKISTAKKIIKVPNSLIVDAFSINSNEFILCAYNSSGFLKRVSFGWGAKENNKFEVCKIDNDLNVVMKATLNQEMYGKRVTIHKLLKFGEKAWIFFSYSNIETQKNYLFAQKFDYINLELEDEPIKVAEMPFKKNRDNFGYYEFDLSENGKYLIISGIPNYHSRQLSIFGIKGKERSKSDGSLTAWVFNDNMEIINYQKKVKLSEGSKKLYIKNTLIGNDGSFAFVGAEDKKEEKRSFLKKLLDKVTPYEFLLVQYDSAGESHNYSFKSKNLKIIDLKAVINNNTGNYQIMALYTDNYKGAKGIVSASLSSDDFSELNYSKIPFSDEFVKESNKRFDSKSTKTQKKSKKKKEDEENNENKDEKPKSKYLGKLDKEKEENDDTEKEEKKETKSSSKVEISKLTKVIDILFDDIDNPIGIFEKQWLEIVTTTSTDSKGRSTTTTNYYYYYGDVVIAKIDSGELSQTQTIRKKGYLVNIYYPEGAMVVSNENKVIVAYKDQQIEYDKTDLKTKYKNASTNRDLRYRMTGFKIKLSPNKAIVTRPKTIRKLEIELIHAK